MREERVASTIPLTVTLPNISASAFPDIASGMHSLAFRDNYDTYRFSLRKQIKDIGD